MNWGRGERHPRPAPPAEGSAVDLPVFATVYRDHVLLYRDMSGASLHRRGYRGAMHRSPLNEAAAAGALLLAEWPSLASQGTLTHVSPTHTRCCSSQTLATGSMPVGGDTERACNEAQSVGVQRRGQWGVTGTTWMTGKWRGIWVNALWLCVRRGKWRGICKGCWIRLGSAPVVLVSGREEVILLLALFW
jgi:hypothetical protein